MSAPKNRKYTKTHEWVLVEGDVATVGITDYAQQELGDITYLELPDAGESISAGESFGIVESVKAVSEIYAPIDGEVIERNESAVEAPEVINQSPYENAWLVKAKLTDPAQIERLLDPADYDAFAELQPH